MKNILKKNTYDKKVIYLTENVGYMTFLHDGTLFIPENIIMIETDAKNGRNIYQ